MDLWTGTSKGNLSDADYHRLLMQEATESLLKGSSLGKVGPANAWQYADILINAKHWPEAKEALAIAVEHAKVVRDEDRRVNDSLRLARVLAELNEVPQAIAMARTVFDVDPKGRVPILYATTDEIIPAARGKGHDLELARLLEDAISLNTHVEVDPNSTPGQMFLTFRPVRTKAAWKLVYELYTDGEKTLNLAEKSRVQGEAMLHDFTQDVHQRA